MFPGFSSFILRNRTVFIISLVLITAFFGYKATQIQLSYQYARTLPLDDPAYIDYEKFKQLYGEDGSVMVLGFRDESFFTLDKFNDWYDLSNQIDTIVGIQDVLSVANLYDIKRNDSIKKFDFTQVINRRPESQQELDSLKEKILALPFYDGLILNSDSSAYLMAITFDKKNLNSKNRIHISNTIEELGNAFAQKHGIDIHFSGMPYVRTVFMKKVSDEMKLFLVLAILVTVVILFLFFRSFYAVFFSVLVCLVGVVISVGTIVLLGYNITILSGLIPPIILIIGVPNCIFIINKYQEELVTHGNKVKALKRAVDKVSLSNFLANMTSAIGFGVFVVTNSSVLVEFGIIASIDVMATFLIAHILLPIIYSYLPAPAPRYTKHLKNKRIEGIMMLIDRLVHKYRGVIYSIITIVTLISLYGMTKVNVNGFVVDDLPRKDPIYVHLRFFEKYFHGVMPFEINIDTGKEDGVFADRGGSALPALYKIQSLQRMINKYDAFSKPVSVVEGLKFAYQAYNDGDPKKYRVLPGAMDLVKLKDYLGTVNGNENKLASFMDSTRRYTRISFQMADVGSDSLKKIMDEIRPKVDTIFNWDRETESWVADSLKYNVALTGHSHVFLKSNDYLYHHLFVALLIAIFLILLIGMVLFRSVAIIVLSKLPCLIPLAITAGIMGFFGIPIKPSTILIFTIAFGIASDGTIYILTEYRHQLKLGFPRSEAISRTIRELGNSMIYTNVILFFGFAIFSASTFGGTKAMGILLSLTLLVSLATNLILLPSILLSLAKKTATKEMLEQPLIDTEAAEYGEGSEKN